MHPFAEAVLANDHEAAVATLAEDVEFRSPAMSPLYSATLFVATPIASPCDASTVPSSVSST